MIREFAYGVSNRHHFQSSSDTHKWQFLSRDVYTSLYAYDEKVKEYYAKNKTLSGYDGDIYMPSEFILDVDGKDVKTAQQGTQALIMLLNDLFIPYNIYFSGRGFHVGISDTCFKWKPGPNLHLKVKDVLTKHGIYELADSSVTDKTRLIRLNNTLNTKSNRWKICIKESELMTMSPLQIESLASKPRRDVKPIYIESDAVFDALEREVKKQTISYKKDIGMNTDPTLHPCISTMMKGQTYGSRHQTALRIAAWLRWRYPEEYVRVLMEYWRQQVTSDEHPFKESEMERIVTDCYKGHNGQGYRYGCMDSIMDKYCKNTCILYKSKKSQTLMTAQDMESNLIDFLKSDVQPLDLGSLYNCEFPIYPGELVIIQAPPKSMKTTIVMNWLTHFKKPTYFLEMEMSPRQIWSRFIMIEKGWDEQQLKDHYRNNSSSMVPDFSWVHVDYASCYAVELEKRISMLEVKPEILVIDHLGLLNSKHSDNNMKLDDISGSITELAIRHNLIVIAISEITKSAFSEGMNVSTIKGSFRIAYNASKVLSLDPKKDKDGNIGSIAVKTNANRERGNLNTILAVKGLKIGTQQQIHGGTNVYPPIIPRNS